LVKPFTWSKKTTITSISTKGQVTIPARLRKKLGLKPRDRVLVEIQEGAIVISLAPDFF
jgi:AbrB family looped-hinge helix DNA binding protein